MVCGWWGRHLIPCYPVLERPPLVLAGGWCCWHVCSSFCWEACLHSALGAGLVSKDAERRG